MKVVVGNPIPQVDHNQCQETTVLSCMLLEKKNYDKVFIFLTLFVHVGQTDRQTDRQTHTHT